MPSISIISEPQAHHYLQQTRRRRCMGLERRIIQSLPDISVKYKHVYALTRNVVSTTTMRDGRILNEWEELGIHKGQESPNAIKR
jgi:hypothetical protein